MLLESDEQLESNIWGFADPHEYLGYADAALFFVYVSCGPALALSVRIPLISMYLTN
jgi:hypothetical protein